MVIVGLYSIDDCIIDYRLYTIVFRLYRTIHQQYIHCPNNYILRMVSEFLPAESTSVIEFDCVMSFSKMQLARIVNMNGNVIISGFGLRTG